MICVKRKKGKRKINAVQILQPHSFAFISFQPSTGTGRLLDQVLPPGLDRARPCGVVTAASELAAGVSLAGAAALAGQESDDDAEEGDDAVDDGH